MSPLRAGLCAVDAYLRHLRTKRHHDRHDGPRGVVHLHGDAGHGGTVHVLWSPERTPLGLDRYRAGGGAMSDLPDWLKRAIEPTRLSEWKPRSVAAAVLEGVAQQMEEGYTITTIHHTPEETREYHMANETCEEWASQCRMWARRLREDR